MISTGLEELLSGNPLPDGETPAEALLDGVKFGPNPLAAGTKESADVLDVSTQFNFSLSGAAFFGLVTAGLQGGSEISITASLAGSTPDNPLVNENEIDAYETLHAGEGEDAGFVGPLSLSASGNADLYFNYWVGASTTVLGHTITITVASGSDEIADESITLYPNPPVNTNNIAPLGFYNTQTQTLTLYVGPLSSLRDGGKDDPIGSDLSNPQDPAAVAAADSANYTIDIASDDHVVINYVNSKGDLETQTPTGPVSVIDANTGDGNDTLLINNDGPDATLVDFSGSGAGAYDNTSASATSSNAVAGAPIGGNDVFYSADGSATLTGGAGNNKLIGGPSADLITAGGGNDTIYSNGGDDTINGGKGNDLIYVGNGNQSVTGGSGNDTIVAGGPGTGQYNSGNDTIPASAPGDSVFNGGGGVNTLDYLESPTSVDVDLTTGKATGADIGNESLSNFNVIEGSRAASILNGGTAGQGSDTIYGESGGDTIVGGGGNDVIIAATNAAHTGNNITGGTGDDTIYGGNGHDTIFGGSGNDSIIGGSGGSSIDGGTGNSTLIGGAGPDTISAANGDNLIETEGGANTVNVGNGNNQIFGDNGTDTIKAGNGDNTIVGGSGDDIILVGFGDNTITGGTGNDSITAGNGANSIIGGQGNDSIVTGSGKNTIYGGAGNDQITAGDGDDIIDGGFGDDIIITGFGDFDDSGRHGPRPNHGARRQQRNRHRHGRQHGHGRDGLGCDPFGQWGDVGRRRRRDRYDHARRRRQYRDRRNRRRHHHRRQWQ